MKITWLIITCLLFTFSTIYSQNLTIGAGINVHSFNNTHNIGGGYNVFGEYRFFENYGLRLTGGGMISSLKEIEYNSSDYYTMTFYEGQILYYPFTGSEQPYIGIGAGYYSPASHNHDMPVFPKIPGEAMLGGNYFGSAYGMNACLGIKLKALNTISFNFELKYYNVSPDWSVKLMKGNDYFKDLGTLSLSSLSANFILAINI